MERLYTPLDTASLDYMNDLGFPGEYPYTRGVYPNMYRGRHWTMRQYAGFGSAAESNARYRYLLDQGQTGLSVAFDLPTLLGFVCDHPLALGVVGRVGVAIDSMADMKTLFAGIPLEKGPNAQNMSPTGVLMADVNIDGYMDIVTSSTGDSLIWIYVSGGDSMDDGQKLVEVEAEEEETHLL